MSKFSQLFPTSSPAAITLYGSCGIDNSWRTPLKDACQEVQKIYFDPYLQRGWQLKRLKKEVRSLYSSELVVVGVHSSTEGYGSLCEIGWSIASSLIEPKDLIFYLEPIGDSVDTYNDFIRVRLLAQDFSQELRKYDPQLFSLCDSYEDFIRQSVVRIKQPDGDRFKPQTKRRRPANVRSLPEVAVFGTSKSRGGNLLPTVIKCTQALQSKDIPAYNPLVPGWNFIDHHENELQHKVHASVAIQIIDDYQSSYGSMVETGLLASASLMMNRPFGVLIKDYTDPDTGRINPNDYPNRLRQLTRRHLKINAKKSGGLIYIASSEADLVDFAEKAYRRVSNQANVKPELAPALA